MESPYRRVYSGDSSRRSLFGRPNSGLRTLSRQASTAASTATLGRVGTPLHTARQTPRLPRPKPTLSRAGCGLAVGDFFSEAKKGNHVSSQEQCGPNGPEESQEEFGNSKLNCRIERLQQPGELAADKREPSGVFTVPGPFDVPGKEQRTTATTAAENEMFRDSSWLGLKETEASPGTRAGTEVKQQTLTEIASDTQERTRGEEETSCLVHMVHGESRTAPAGALTVWNQDENQRSLPPHAPGWLPRQPFFTRDTSLASLHSLPLMSRPLSSRTILRTELSIEKKPAPGVPPRTTQPSRGHTRRTKNEEHLTGTSGPVNGVPRSTERRSAACTASPATQPALQRTPPAGTRSAKARPCRNRPPTSLETRLGKKARSSSSGLPTDRVSHGGTQRSYTGGLSGGRRPLSKSCLQTPGQPQLSVVSSTDVNLAREKCPNFALGSSLPPTSSLLTPPFSIDIKALREATASLGPDGSLLHSSEGGNAVCLTQCPSGNSFEAQGDLSPADSKGWPYPSKHCLPLSEEELATSASASCALVPSAVSSPEREATHQEGEDFTLQSNRLCACSETESNRCQKAGWAEAKHEVVKKDRADRFTSRSGNVKKSREESPSKTIVLQGLSPRSTSEVKREMKKWFKERNSASRRADFWQTPGQKNIASSRGQGSTLLNKLPDEGPPEFLSTADLAVYYKKQIGKYRTASFSDRLTATRILHIGVTESLGLLLVS